MGIDIVIFCTLSFANRQIFYFLLYQDSELLRDRIFFSVLSRNRVAPNIYATFPGSPLYISEVI